LVRDGDPEHSELRHRLVDIGREPFAFIEFGGHGADFAIRELARRVADSLMAIEVALGCRSDSCLPRCNFVD